MAGPVCVVGSCSSLAEYSKSCGCLCSGNLSAGDLILKKHPPLITWRKQQVAPPIMELNTNASSFLDYSSIRALSRRPNYLMRKPIRKKYTTRLVVVDQLPRQHEEDFEDIKKQMLDYFTYKAVRTVLNQLYEMNPSQYRWFYNYVASNEHGFGKTFIRKLVKDKQELAERVMVTRLHLYERWTKLCDHTKMYERISDQNLELMRERLMETVIWPSDDTNTEVLG